MTAALQVEGLAVAYGATPVLHDIDLAVAAGEFVALLGPSGCGKTTLLRAVAGFVPVAAGRILANGRDLAPLPPEARGCAMVFQSYALWPHMNVAANIGYGLRLRGWKRARVAARVEAMLALLRLDGLGGRMPGALSGGQRQRVALGRALAIEPSLLLLDEPMSNLDARVREGLRHELRALQQALGITVLHVTHDREEAMLLADRIVLLDAGRIAQQGPPDVLWRQPATPFVADFLGAVNALPWDGGTLRFRPEDARLLGPGDAAEGAVFAARVAQAGYAGGRWRLALTVGDATVLADAAERLAPGTELSLCIPWPAAHRFGADTEASFGRKLGVTAPA